MPVGNKHPAQLNHHPQHEQTTLQTNSRRFAKYSKPTPRKRLSSHLTLGMTQNANESLHNVIWNLCPKAKYISPHSVRISTAIAVTIFNEDELCLYGSLPDLKLNPFAVSFRSVCKREQVKKQYRLYIKSANVHRRARRQKLTKLRREQQLFRLEGGRSYKSNTFGAETFTKPSRPRRGRRQMGANATTAARATRSRGKCVKRRLVSPFESDESEQCASDTESSNTDKESESIHK